MTVSIIVPVWNGRALLEKLLESIERQTIQPLDVIVVDNGSEDGAPELAARWGARLIRLGRNTGFAHAVNCGIRESRSDSLAVINSDVELDSAWLQNISGPEAWFATGRILSSSQPGILDGTYDLICRGGCAWRAGNGYPDQPPFDVPSSISLAPFTAALFRSELFRNVGLLDEQFESYLEDVDFGLRCAADGYEGVYVPSALCWHRGSATLGKWDRASVRRMSRNQVFLVAKHYPAPLIPRWLWPVLVAQLLWGGVAFRHGAGWSFLKGKAEGLARFRLVRRTSARLDLRILSEVVIASERNIYSLQQVTGFDTYWRMYFALVSKVTRA